MDAATEPMTPGLSLRSNFAWILTGNVVYAACQWGAIVALAKLGSSFMIGQFSLGLAIATPVLMFTNLHLRAVQATDARRLSSFGEYLRLRGAMTLCGLAVIGGIAWFGNYERQTAMVILAVALAKGIETLSDIHYGLFQLNDRLDQIGRSMMLRGGLSVVALSTGLYATHNVLWGCVGLALVWLAALLFFDVPRGRRFVADSARSRRAGGPGDPKASGSAIPAAVESDAHGAAAGDFDDHGGPQSQYAALFYSRAAGGTSARYLFGDGLCHGGDDPGRRLVGTLRHPAVVQAVLRGAAGGVSIAAAQNGGGRRRPGTCRSGGGAGSWACGCSPCFMAASMPLTIGFSWC